MKDKTKIFITLNGVEVPYRAIDDNQLGFMRGGLRQEYIDRGEPLEPPTYEVEFAGGEKKTYPHDETSLDQHGDPQENRRAWEAHLDAVRRFESESNELWANMVLDEGCALEKPADWSETDEMEWEKKQKTRHIQVPEDPQAKWRHYLSTEVLRSQYDLKNFLLTVTMYSKAGVVDQEALNAVIGNFQRPVPAK